LDQLTQAALEELGLGVGAPRGRNWAVAPAHGSLKLLVSNFVGQEGCENDLHVFVNKVDLGEAELERDVVVELYQVLDGQEDRPQRVFNDVLAHLAGGGNGNGVGVDHAEALLVNGSLGLGRRYPFFAVVSYDVVLEFFVNDENGSKLLQLQLLT